MKAEVPNSPDRSASSSSVRCRSIKRSPRPGTGGPSPGSTRRAPPAKPSTKSPRESQTTSPRSSRCRVAVRVFWSASRKGSPALLAERSAHTLDQLLPLDLVQSAPDTVRFPDPQRVVEARPFHRAARAHRLREVLAFDLFVFGLRMGGREENDGLRPSAQRLELPGLLGSHRGRHGSSSPSAMARLAGSAGGTAPAVGRLGRRLRGGYRRLFALTRGLATTSLVARAETVRGR